MPLLLCLPLLLDVDTLRLLMMLAIHAIRCRCSYAAARYILRCRQHTARPRMFSVLFAAATRCCALLFSRYRIMALIVFFTAYAAADYIIASSAPSPFADAATRRCASAAATATLIAVTAIFRCDVDAVAAAMALLDAAADISRACHAATLPIFNTMPPLRFFTYRLICPVSSGHA